MPTTLRSRTLKATSTWDRDTASETRSAGHEITTVYDLEALQERKRLGGKSTRHWKDELDDY